MIGPLDTLEIAKRLQRAGFDTEQAEAITGVLRDTREADLSRLATRDDLARIEERLARIEAAQARFATKDDLAALEARIDARLEIMRRDLTIRLASIVGALLAGAVALIGLLIKLLH